MMSYGRQWTVFKKSKIGRVHDKVKDFKMDLSFFIGTNTEIKVDCGKVASFNEYETKICEDETKLAQKSRPDTEH